MILAIFSKSIHIVYIFFLKLVALILFFKYLFLKILFLTKAIVSSELSIYFLSENKDKFKTPHKFFHNSNFVLVRTKL